METFTSEKEARRLARKLLAEAAENEPQITADLRKLPKAADRTNDSLRYTFVLPFETYADGVRRTIESLRESGYLVPENKIWNAWQIAGSDKDRGYRGINITVISSENQKFELQFHTRESFKLKDETHFLYEELRSAAISTRREEELIDILRKSAVYIEKPDGV